MGSTSPPRYRKLNQMQWDEIRLAYEAGSTVARLARMYGVSPSAIHSRKRKHGWILTKAVNGETVQSEDLLAVARSGAGMEPPDEGLLGGTQTSAPPDSSTIPPALPSTSSQANQSAEDILRSAGVLLHRVNQVMAAPDRYTPKNKGMSRTLLEMAQTLEKVQKMVRVALGMEGGDSRGPRVIIVVPDKLPADEWQRRALEGDFEVVDQE